MKIKLIIGVVGLIGIGLILGRIIWADKSSQVINPEKLYTVKRVIDGDTMVIDNNQEVRLANVGAPEIGRCGASEAKNELEKIVLNKKVRIEGNVNDKWGRLLVNMYIDNNLVNEMIIQTGWVRYISQGDNKQLSMVDDVVEAQGKGIYGLCVEKSNRENRNCLIKGNNREGSKIFVLVGCKGYTNTNIEKDLGDEWFCNEKEAVAAGYRKAENCE
jgi:endonuclease YncB( thermonuclease family)